MKRQFKNKIQDYCVSYACSNKLLRLWNDKRPLFIVDVHMQSAKIVYDNGMLPQFLIAAAQLVELIENKEYFLSLDDSEMSEDDREYD